MTKKETAQEVAKLLKQKHPEPLTELVHSNEMELVVSCAEFLDVPRLIVSPRNIHHQRGADFYHILLSFICVFLSHSVIPCSSTLHIFFDQYASS